MFFILFVLVGQLAFSQASNGPAPIEPKWYAYPSANNNTYGVYHFRKKIQMAEVPDIMQLAVSADNRYNLFVNGERVAYGPAKGDLKTYKYDVVDIAPFLVPGANMVALLVHNAGEEKPLSFISSQTAFLCQPKDQEYQALFDAQNWKAHKSKAYDPITYYEMLFKERWFYGFYACGPGDDFDAKEHPWGWEKLDFEDTDWKTAELLVFDGKAPWNLIERNIPFMDDHVLWPASIREAENIEPKDQFLSGGASIVVPPQTKAKVLMDFGVMTMGYPEIEVDGGAGGHIKVNYAEALYDAVNLKAHRDSVVGKTMYGVWDVFRPDGGQERLFRPLWKRTFRYVQLEIETKDQPLQINSYMLEYSGYPYKNIATFESDDARLNQIFEMGQRTLAMCSGETYYDTPYYEQLSYGGDNRPIGNLSFYTTTDDRLFKEVMRLYPQSINRETKLMKSAYPSRFTFDQGSWSLAWVQSLHDYYFMRGDALFVEPFFENIEGVLNFYDRHIDEEKQILGTVNNRNFMDWSITKGNIPRANEQGEMVNSTLLSLFYLHTLDCTVRLYKALGNNGEAEKWKGRAEHLRKGIFKTSWDKGRGLIADSPDLETFSQHANILAILTDVVPQEEQADLMDRILQKKEFDEYASSFFSFFLFKAMEKTSRQGLFLDHLGFWHEFIDRGLTTMGETGFASHDRSDSHAWSAHPSYFLLRFVGGIYPADTGFNSVLIQPSLGALNKVKATIPHPKGRIEVEYEKGLRTLRAKIVLPKGLTGTFNYGGKEFELTEGENKIKV